MAIITGYTAERMNQFNNASVISGTVNTSGSLILKTRGGTSIDAGKVKGDKGDPVAPEQLAVFVPKWKAGTAYTVGQQVIAPVPANAIVSCISAHTSSSAFSTDVASRWSNEVFAGTTAERNTIFGTPSTDAAIIALANKQVRFYNTTEGWWESYYSTAKTGLTTTPLIAGNAIGWYPDAGSDLRAHRGVQSGFQRIEATKTLEPVMGDLLLNTKSRFSKQGNSGIGLPYGGYYRLFANAYMSGSLTDTFSVAVSLNINSTLIRSSNNKVNAQDVETSANGIYPFQKTDVIRMFIYTAQAVSCWGTTGYNGTRFTIEYAGPPLSN